MCILLLQTLPKGSSAEVYFYGATVTSWKAGSSQHPDPKERLFVSSKALLDGSKAIRGGIPVVFPCFGAPTHPDHQKLSQHGFARSSVWKFDNVVLDSEAGVSVRLGWILRLVLLQLPDRYTPVLEPTPAITAVWSKPFKLAYIITLSEHHLSTDIHVTNTSTSTVYPPESFEFQALFHNYIRAPADKVLVTPLKGINYKDKTDSSVQGPKTESRAGVDVKAFTDSVYIDASQNYEVSWPGDAISIKSLHLKDVVVWNPQAEAGSKMG